MNILETKELKVYFHQHNRLVKALDGVDLFLPHGKTAALVGSSGCGKTTLARTILGLYRPLAGKIYLNNTDITLPHDQKLLRENVRMVFQNPVLSFDPRFRIQESLREALPAARAPDRRQDQKLVLAALEEAGLDAPAAGRFPHELSGGQLQRAAIARALIKRPSVVIFDEPFSSLDAINAGKILGLLLALKRTLGTAYLVITHDIRLAARIADLIFVMRDGKIIECGPAEALVKNPGQKYTQLLLDAAFYRLKE